jgi:hypothetical protein
VRSHLAVSAVPQSRKRAERSDVMGSVGRWQRKCGPRDGKKTRTFINTETGSLSGPQNNVARSWLMHFATSRNVVGSIPGGVVGNSH